MLPRARILVIDDQPANLLVVEAMLRDSDYEVVTAPSGKEGLARLHESDFAAILIDVQMPEMDGFETALWVRARGVRTPIIFLTATPRDELHTMRGYEAGAMDFLYQPLNSEILRAKLSVLTELYRGRREMEIRSAQIEAHAERRYRDLVEGIHNGIVWTAVLGTGKYSFVSPSAQQISGYPHEAWMTEKYFMREHSHPDDRQGLVDVYEKLVANGGDVDFEHRFVRADGSTLWFHTTIRVADLTGYRELRGLSVDITYLKETEQSLRNSITLRDEFLSIASHELKTPLTPLQLQIEGFQLLGKRGELTRVPPEKLAHMLEVSAAQVHTLTRLVDQLLDVSRIKSGRIDIERADMDLTALVRKVALNFQINLELGDVSLELDLPDSMPGFWDPVRLEQMLVNLLDNALKYGMGKPLRIVLRQEDATAHLTVTDQGIGIAEADLDRIFERFERAVSAGHYSGMGLGLYITRQIVELHGGRIAATSRLGEGSSFTVHLPIHERPAPL